MSINIPFDQCVSFLNSQLKPSDRPTPPPALRFRAITLSRQAGSGANLLAEKLVTVFERMSRKLTGPWTVLDRNLVGKVLEDHQLPGRLAKFFPEDRLTELQDIMDEVFGLRPASWTLVEQTSETMLHLAALGNVILVGRGGNIVTRRLQDVLHVRLIGSLEVRARRIAERRGMTRKSALDYIAKTDTGRRRYVKKYFSADIDDPQLYHLVINTDLVSVNDVAEMLARIVTKGF
jgi:hypothetical protein